MASKLWGKLGESVSTDLEAEFPGLDLDLYDTNAGYILSKIALPKEERGFGIGTQVMRRLIDIADSEGKMIALTPDTTFGGSKSRLIQFYKRFGFVPNKGRNKTFDFRETMVRYPRSNENVNEIQSMTGYPKGKITYWNHDEEKLKKVGKLGDYNIHKSIESEADGGDHVFVIKKDETPLGELILTQRDSPFAQGKKQGFWTSSVHFDPKIQGKGLAVPLYAYAVKKGYDIVSDNNQSKGSEILWQKLSKKPGINVYAWDRENNKFFAYDPEEDPRGQVYSDDDLKQKLIDEYLEMMRKANSQEEKDELDKELKKELADITPDGYDTRLVAVSKTKKTQETLEEALSDISKSSQVFVDMDGVLADFFGSWKKLVGKDWREIDTKDIPAALQKIRDTKDFWLKIPPTPNAGKLLGLIKKLKGSYNILSAPLPNDPNSEPHKRAWIEKYLKVFPPSRVIITHDKAKYATQSDGTPNILIDDFGQNIAKWEAAGGVGFKHKDHKFERTVKSLKQNMNEGSEGSYLLQLERDGDLLVLHIKHSKTGKRTEVRGKPDYEGDGYDSNDPLHQLLDKIGKAAGISDLMNGEPVTINPKHPDGDRAKKTVTKIANEDKDFNELNYVLKKEVPNDKAVMLTKLGKFHDGADELEDYVPERKGKQYALHPENWKGTYYSLTNKDTKKINFYKPKIVTPAKGSMVADMAIANKFYRTKDEAEKKAIAQEYKNSMVPYGSDISKIKFPEILMPSINENFADGKKEITTKKIPSGFTLDLMVDGNHVGQYTHTRDDDIVRNFAEIFPEYRNKGYGTMLLLAAIKTADDMGMDFEEDTQSLTPAMSRLYDELSDSGLIYGGGGAWTVSPSGENELEDWLLEVTENFADGKVKGKSRPGRVKRAGASCKGSVTDLRAKAKKYSGERGKMYHWCANMKSGSK